MPAAAAPLFVCRQHTPLVRRTARRHADAALRYAADISIFFAADAFFVGARRCPYAIDATLLMLIVATALRYYAMPCALLRWHYYGSRHTIDVAIATLTTPRMPMREMFITRFFSACCCCRFCWHGVAFFVTLFYAACYYARCAMPPRCYSHWFAVIARYGLRSLLIYSTARCRASGDR